MIPPPMPAASPDEAPSHVPGSPIPCLPPPSGETRDAWVHLANLQFSARLTTTLLAHFGYDPRTILAAGDRDLDAVPGFQSRHAVRLRDPAARPTDRQIAWLDHHGVRLLLRGQEEYPLMLNDIADPPPLLFVRGALLDADRTSVGIVGSRHATPYGKATAERLAHELACHGVTVISGGAVGIDASAHRGAVAGGGRTIAILGCGLDVDYPRENQSLFEQVAAQGALISEYPPGTQPESWRFPARNRLISGMSLGVLVIEAPRQSGALITARFAAEHGRPVLATPGNIDRVTSQGSNELLKDGAYMVTETEDILRALDLVVLPARPSHQRLLDLEWQDDIKTDGATATIARPPTQAAAVAAPRNLRSLPEAQQQLLACLSHTPQHLDAISQKAGLNAVQASVEMTLLELEGLVRRLPGNSYILAI